MLGPVTCAVSYAGWMARVGSGIFLVAQMLILLDFTHLLNDTWFQKGEENIRYMYLLLGVTIACYVGTLVMAVLGFYIFRSTEGNVCTFNVSILVWSLILAVGFSILSVHPAAAHGSLFPASVISAYCMYLCLAALESEPRGECNSLTNKAASGSAMFFAMLLTLAAVIYSAFRAGSNTATFFTNREGELHKEQHRVAARLPRRCSLGCPGSLDAIPAFHWKGGGFWGRLQWNVPCSSDKLRK